MEKGDAVIEDLGGVTSQLISLALDAALVRHKVIANNIANVHTPGYQAKSLHFEKYLSGFISSLRNSEDSALIPRIESLKASLIEGGPMVVSENETVELDREMLKLTENTLRYQAIVKAAGKQGDLLSMAINGGRK
jgi:flagellar basal-body rod protein FlgB